MAVRCACGLSSYVTRYTLGSLDVAQDYVAQI